MSLSSPELSAEARLAQRRWVDKKGISPKARLVVPPLVGALSDPEPRVRHAAAWALAEIGPDAREAAPELTRVLADADDMVRLEAARASFNVALEPDEPLRTVLTVLKTAKQADTRIAALDVLERMLPFSRDARDAVHAAWRLDPSIEVWERAKRLLDLIDVLK